MPLCAIIPKSQGHAAIAQLDRVTDYESVGRGFESLSPYQKTTQNQTILGGFSCLSELF